MNQSKINIVTNSLKLLSTKFSLRYAICPPIQNFISEILEYLE